MFVHDLECSWLDHPFSTNQFVVASKADIDKIVQASITQLSIDTERGLDIEAEQTAQPKVTPVKKPAGVKKVAAAPLPPKTELKGELKRAVKVREEATEVISGIMDDARLGKQVAIDKIGPVVENMVESVMGNTNALLGLTRIREMDQYTFEHSVSVSILLTAFAKHLGMSREDTIEVGVGGILHDIGKTKTPQNVLNKPARLTNDEFAIMRKHVAYSKEILADVPGISDIALSIVLEHHERFDGSGYPLKKKGDEISLYGQMAAIVDVYDAITADRCYHKGMAPSAAMKKLNQWSGSHFNPELVQTFIHCVGIYPPSTLVSLSDGSIAVVLETTAGNLLFPVVRVIFDSFKRSFLPQKDIDLSAQGDNPVKILGSVDPGKWRIDPTEYMDVPGS